MACAHVVQLKDSELLVHAQAWTTSFYGDDVLSCEKLRLHYLVFQLPFLEQCSLEAILFFDSVAQKDRL